MSKYAIYRVFLKLNKDETEYVDCEEYEVREVHRGSQPYGSERFSPVDEETLQGICNYLNRDAKRRAKKAG